MSSSSSSSVSEAIINSINNLSIKPSPSAPKALDLSKALLEQCESGAQGDVYTTRYRREKVAVKVYTQKVEKEELSIVMALQHKNIIRLIGYGKHNDKTALVMEFCPTTLGKEIYAERMISCDNFVLWLREMVAGLKYLHSKGIIHRDIKPENILISQNGHVRICDFGIAKFVDNQMSNTIKGTVRYLAPEVLLKEKDAISFKMDIWALGVVVWEVLSRTKPYAHLGNDNAIFYALSQRTLCLSIPSNSMESLQNFLIACRGSKENRPSLHPSSDYVNNLVDIIEAENQEYPGLWPAQLAIWKKAAVTSVCPEDLKNTESAEAIRAEAKQLRDKATKNVLITQKLRMEYKSKLDRVNKILDVLERNFPEASKEMAELRNIAESGEIVSAENGSSLGMANFPQLEEPGIPRRPVKQPFVPAYGRTSGVRPVPNPRRRNSAVNVAPPRIEQVVEQPGVLTTDSSAVPFLASNVRDEMILSLERDLLMSNGVSEAEKRVEQLQDQARA